MGLAAVDALLEGRTNVMVGEIHGKIAFTPLGDTWSKRKAIDNDLWRLARILST
jgi:6-phosphofructokinase 1